MRFMVMVKVVIPPGREDEAAALLPAEREHVAEHVKQGIMEALYVDTMRPPTRIWAVMRAESLEAVQQLVEGYPMYEFFDLTYTQLSEQ